MEVKKKLFLEFSEEDILNLIYEKVRSEGYKINYVEVNKINRGFRPRFGDLANLTPSSIGPDGKPLLVSSKSNSGMSGGPAPTGRPSSDGRPSSTGRPGSRYSEFCSSCVKSPMNVYLEVEPLKNQ